MNKPPIIKKKAKKIKKTPEEKKIATKTKNNEKWVKDIKKDQEAAKEEKLEAK